MFPTNLVDLPNPDPKAPTNSPVTPLAGGIANLNAVVEALQAKVGIDGSTVPTSIDKRLSDTESVANAALVATSEALGSLVASSAEEPNPNASDQVLLSDTSASGIAKKVPWSGFQKMARAQARRPWRFRGKLLADGSSLTGWTPQSNVTLSVVAKPAGGLSTYRSNGEWCNWNPGEQGCPR